MNELKTASGKVFPCNFFVFDDSEGEAHIRIQNTPIETVAKVFYSKSETAQIWYGNQYLANYTNLQLIAPEANGTIHVALRKE